MPPQRATAGLAGSSVVIGEKNRGVLLDPIFVRSRIRPVLESISATSARIRPRPRIESFGSYHKGGVYRGVRNIAEEGFLLVPFDEVAAASVMESVMTAWLDAWGYEQRAGFL